jgi:hypothetical protein
VRRLLWEPPLPETAADAADARDRLAERVAERLAELGARQWQTELTKDLLAAAILEAAAGATASEA